MPLVKEVPCPLCGSWKRRPWREIQNWMVVCCQDCGMKFANPCPTEEALAKAYALPEKEYYRYFQSSYIDYKKILGEQATWKKKYAQEYLGLIEKKLGHKGRIFELGCGSGIFLAEARNRGWETAGVDFGDWRHDPEGDRTLHIKRCSIFDCHFPENSFDAVFMASVLEHLQDPRRYLQKLYALLKPGGIICATGVPNVHSFTILLKVDRWIGNHPPSHLLFFSRKTARELFDKVGFHDIRIRSYGLSETLLEMVFNRGGRFYSGDYASLVHQENKKGALLRFWRFLVYGYLDLLGMGSVLEILAKK